MERVGIGLMEALSIIGICSLFLMIIVVMAIVAVFLIRKNKQEN